MAASQRSASLRVATSSERRTCAGAIVAGVDPQRYFFSNTTVLSVA
jgi:hypothetical protein